MSFGLVGGEAGSPCHPGVLAMNMHYSNRRGRRGMLLLLVLTMLTLFLLMGTALLVLATRARTAARAFMAATSDFEVAPTVPRAVLDEALLALIRGSQATDANGQPVIPESLLRDMYETDGNRVAFRNEPYDAFGGTDPYLTEFENGAVKTPVFSGGRPAEVDNDADGVPDGVWLERLIPEMTSPSGGRLTFRVSYLVRDLDGRINVNAHGGGNGDPLDAANPVGPADIDASTLSPFAGGRWELLQQGGSPTAAAGPLGLRRAPALGRPAGGRAGNAYGLRLDRDADRPAEVGDAAGQNPFTIGELERVLRPFDLDCFTLPPRLAALLDDLDHSARDLVTTDSWDVTAPVGAAAGGQPTRFDLTSSPADKAAFARGLYAAIAGVAGSNMTTAQWVANVAEFRNPTTAAAAMTLGEFTVTGVNPSVLGGAAGPWPDDGRFVSPGDLLAVPRGTKDEIEPLINNDPPLPPLEAHSPLHSLVSSKPGILGAVMVPSRFTATIAADPTREPGRVNVNTCEPGVWQAVAAGGPPGRPGRPYESLGELLNEAAGGDQDVRHVDRPLANRLASVATVRSNVFAVWITLEATDSALTAESPACYRMFAIVDRSIPVEYAEGQNKDVRKTIRLKRFLN
jgi:hypothetical protein